MNQPISENKKILALLGQLKDKYANAGQDLEHYLQGLLEANFEPYWEYINLESLLALQQPKTDHPDELIFIAYHQYTELFFKLILHEIVQIKENKEMKGETFLSKIKRINRYILNLVSSFDIMIDGMEHKQFLQFRMALLPASGFQSAQYRLIELALTNIENLVDLSQREGLSKMSFGDKLENLYWRKGAIDKESGKKTLTLKQFEKHYDSKFTQFAIAHSDSNIYQRFLDSNFEEELTVAIKEEMRQLDYNLNVNWRLAHFKSAVKYLKSKDDPIEATGGTNWTSYLPPRFQKIIAFPNLWSAVEKEDWGKQWVSEQINS